MTIVRFGLCLCVSVSTVVVVVVEVTIRFHRSFLTEVYSKSILPTIKRPFHTPLLYIIAYFILIIIPIFITVVNKSIFDSKLSLCVPISIIAWWYKRKQTIETSQKCSTHSHSSSHSIFYS